MKRSIVVLGVIVSMIIIILMYGAIGTSGNVDEIKRLAPQVIAERGWEVMRYEGYQHGSFGKHGGKVWYHVRNDDDYSIQYRVYITMWDGELHFHYNEPEKLNRVNVEYMPQK